MKRNVVVAACFALSVGVLVSCSKAPEAPKTATQDNTQSPSTQSGNQTASSPTSTSTPDSANKVVDLNKFSSDTTICTVGGSPVTVADYKRMYRLEAIQLQNGINSDPLTRAKLVEQAKALGLDLSADEKSQALEAAKKSLGTGTDFQSFLKKNNVSEAQFNQQVYDARLATKAADAVLSQGLLNDLVNQQILCNAGQAKGLDKKAMNRYIEIKHSKTYEDLQHATGFDAEDLKAVLMKSELAKAMTDQIQEQARPKATDAEMRVLYNKNRKLFQHKERIRISQIIIAAPAQDMPGTPSVKTQLMKAHPELKGKDLDKAVDTVMQRQQMRAAVLLQEALAGSNFATLANDNTDENAVKQSKNGGDMGYKERSQMDPQFADLMWKMKTGQVVPKIIKDNLGFHIMKVTSHEKAGPVAMNEVRPLLERNVLALKDQQSLSNWLANERQKTKITLAPQFESLLKTGGSSGTTNSVSGLNSTVQH